MYVLHILSVSVALVIERAKGKLHIILSCVAYLALQHFFTFISQIAGFLGKS
jgi:hypothetical protein